MVMEALRRWTKLKETKQCGKGRDISERDIMRFDTDGKRWIGVKWSGTEQNGMDFVGTGREKNGTEIGI